VVLGLKPTKKGKRCSVRPKRRLRSAPSNPPGTPSSHKAGWIADAWRLQYVLTLVVTEMTLSLGNAPQLSRCRRSRWRGQLQQQESDTIASWRPTTSRLTAECGRVEVQSKLHRRLENLMGGSITDGRDGKV
jgi:hypothetical protein